MARRAEVNVVIQGDPSDLTAAFDKVGAEARDMANDVGKQVSRMSDDVDKGSRDIGGAIDDSEGKFRGFGDVIGGTGDIMDGFKEGNIAGMAMGFADLAGGISDFVVPALGAMKTALLTGLAPALTAISAHPLIAAFLIGGAIVAALFVLEKKFGVVSKAVNFLKENALDPLLGVFGRLGGAIGGAFTAGIDIARSAINGLISLIERGFNIVTTPLRLQAKAFNFLPGIPDLPDFVTDGLKLPRLHSGGVVGGVPGSDQIRVLQAGETVLPRGQGAGGGGMTFIVQGSVITERDLGRIVADALRQNKLIGVTV